MSRLTRAMHKKVKLGQYEIFDVRPVDSCSDKDLPEGSRQKGLTGAKRTEKRFKFLSGYTLESPEVIIAFVDFQRQFRWRF